MVPPTRSLPAKKKRRVSRDAPDVVVPAIAKCPAKALTPVAAAVAALAKRRNDAQQVNIAFDCREKFPIGTKLLLPQSIYPKASDVSWLVVVCFRLCFLPSCVLSKIFVFLLQVPERARGYLFEYEIIKLDRSGPIIRYNNRIYKPGADSFETFKESEECQTMSYPAEEINKLHELWQKATGTCNA